MTYTHTQKKKLAYAFAFVSAMMVFTLVLTGTGGKPSASNRIATACEGTCHGAATEDLTSAERLAVRLKNRLERSGMQASEAALVRALEERDAMLARTVTVTVRPTGTGAHTDSWTFSAAEHPGILHFVHDWSGPRFAVQEDVLKRILSSSAPDGMHMVVNPVVTSIASDGYVMRTNDMPRAQDGFVYDMENLAERIADALKSDTAEISLELPYKQAYITLQTGSGTQKLTLLATGISDYSNSPDERVWNVHKAIDERTNNIAVERGAKFSFNATLGGPVTLDKGWKEGMGLFGGGAALTPGAGICQAATTVFRAALLAGFPITEKRNHSMFVDHYVPYGVGLDATIFPGVHDMSFINDTASHIIIQAHIRGDDVFVNIYGIDDNREVTLDGPYFASTRPRAKELRPLGQEEIGWVRQVTYADGTVKTMPSIAWYHKGFLRSVVTRYTGKGMELLTSKAPVDVL